MTRGRHGLVRWLALALLLGGYRTGYLRHLVPRASLSLPPGAPSGIDRRPLHERLDPLASDLTALLVEAAERIPAGASVRYLPDNPEQGASYAYYRAGHALAGRKLLRPDTSTGADWVLSWGRRADPSGYHRVWSRGEAALLVRDAP